MDIEQAKKIGDILGVDWNQINLQEFYKGINVEFEHETRFPATNITYDDKRLTANIAWEHLKELPGYYTLLEKMQEELQEFWINE